MEESQTEETVGQEAEVSVEDRIADIFLGKEEPKAPEQEAEPEQAGEDAQAHEESEPELFEIELQGEKYSVPASVRDAIMREADYTQKTTELANTRRAIEAQQKELALVAERRKFDASVADDVKNLELIEAYLANQQRTDWTRLDHAQKVDLQLEINQLSLRRDELRQSLNAKWTEYKTKEDAERSKLRKEASDALAKSIPSWSDETRTAIEKYAISLGYPELAAQNMSMQDYQVAWKAMQYDKLQADKASAVKQASQKQGKVLTPGPRKTMSDKTAKYLNYRKQMKSANPSQKRALLADRIADKFMPR